MSELHILVIDDNPSDRTLVIRELERSFGDCLRVTEIRNQDELTQALRQTDFDLVVTDYELRWSNGLEVLKASKAIAPDIPVVMFTNSGSEEVAVEAMKSGLDDYVIKSLNRYGRLAISVRRELEEADNKRKTAGLEERYQTLLNRLNVGSYRLTAEGELIEANSAFFRLLGVPIQDSTQLKLKPYFQPEIYSRLLAQLQQNGEMQEQEAQLQRADGSILWVRISKTLVSSGSTQIVDGLLEDVSDRKQAEQEREDLLRREQAARADAENANRIKDEFLAIVSHELRSPLNSILGWANLLQTRSMNPATMSKAFQTIERNARLQNKLIDDILDISRIVQGKLQLTFQPVYLPPVINAVVEDIRPAAEAKRIQINTQLDAQLAPVMGDPDRLQQVVGNLLSNAIKFTPEGGQVQVRLEPGKVEADRGTRATSLSIAYVKIIVSDTGQGIRTDFLPYVFDRFRQADSSHSRTQGGLGLGLAIVRSLVELHHGTVTAASRGEGQGATFTVELPTQPTRIESNDAPQLAARPTDLAGLRVLLVDDDADNRELIRFILEQCQAEVREAASAREAFDLLPSFQPQLLISDIGMPEENGYSLMRRIRAREAQQSRTEQISPVPAIALTAFAKIEDQQQALAAGFQRYLAKPIDPDVLMATVANLIPI
ncbi:response regulator [Phormidium tenue FACHB-886]|nr:response regulator [Phormidium tenue FACHB-886]